MEKILNISLVGVGGQGTLLASEILCRVALLSGQDVKKSEVHGMAQRGGSVISQVRIGPKVYSPIIAEGQTDFLVAFEKVEALRYAHLLSANGTALVNDQEIRPVTVSSGLSQWPEDLDSHLVQTFPKMELFPALRMAQELGNVRVMNVCMMGALSKFSKIEESIWLEAIKELVPPKVININLLAFESGKAACCNVVG